MLRPSLIKKSFFHLLVEAALETGMHSGLVSFKVVLCSLETRLLSVKAKLVLLGGFFSPKQILSQQKKLLKGFSILLFDVDTFLLLIKGILVHFQLLNPGS
jgi:hypothetical protein